MCPLLVKSDEHVVGVRLSGQTFEGSFDALSSLSYKIEWQEKFIACYYRLAINDYHVTKIGSFRVITVTYCR